MHSGQLCGTTQCLEFFCGLFADLQPFTIRYQPVVQFLTARLYNEILLGQGDLRFARIAIHRNEVTGEAGEVVVLNFALSAFAQRHHFAGAGKMVVRLVPRLFANLLCPRYNLMELVEKVGLLDRSIEARYSFRHSGKPL